MSPRVGFICRVLFYTGFEEAPDWARILEEASSRATCAIGLAELRLER